MKTAFAGLNRRSAMRSFPRPTALADTLAELVPENRNGAVPIDPNVAGLFATAAVDIWLRGIHSFLISTALTRASPVWSSVAGYYASHYSVRGIAHLLGFFNIYRKGPRKGAIAHFNIQANQLICDFTTKDVGGGEHKFYWKAVHSNPHFENDPLFPLNHDFKVVSDASHRGRANYADHLQRLPAFQSLDEREIKDRVQRISDMDFDTPPIPSCDNFPDLDSVQIVAYQRIIRFRQFVDEILGTDNRFWSVQRDPTWVRGTMNFQMTDHSGIRAAPRLQ